MVKAVHLLLGGGAVLAFIFLGRDAAAQIGIELPGAPSIDIAGFMPDIAFPDISIMPTGAVKGVKEVITTAGDTLTQVINRVIPTWVRDPLGYVGDKASDTVDAVVGELEKVDEFVRGGAQDIIAKGADIPIPGLPSGTEFMGTGKMIMSPVLGAWKLVGMFYEDVRKGTTWVSDEVARGAKERLTKIIPEIPSWYGAEPRR